jgi:hypothetical protein
LSWRHLLVNAVGEFDDMDVEGDGRQVEAESAAAAQPKGDWIIGTKVSLS